jgi:hypothetical protein
VGYLIVAVVCFLVGLWPLGIVTLAIGLVMQAGTQAAEADVFNDYSRQEPSGCGWLLLGVMALAALALLSGGIGATVQMVDPSDVRTTEILRALTEAAR